MRTNTKRRLAHVPSTTMLSRIHVWLLLLSAWCRIFVAVVAKDDQQYATTHTPPISTCAEWSGAECGWEPNLQPMLVNFGSYNETFYAYVPPDVSTFYNQTSGSLVQVRGRFNGMFGKFINLSPDPIRVWWNSNSNSNEKVYIADIEPFGSAGTATYPGHRFSVTPANDENKVLMKFFISSTTSLYYYDPFNNDPHKAHKTLSDQEYMLYHIQYHNKVFAEQYKEFTGGTEWLALYRQKLPPRFHMYRADYFGQTYTVETKEIHYVSSPKPEELQRGKNQYGPQPDVIQSMRKYRDKYPTLNLTVTAISCSPRAFEILHFLSDFEVEHLLNIAKSRPEAFKQSKTKAGADGEEKTDDATRTSTNTWIPRNTDIITDAIYRRAADLLSIHEALFRWRRPTELPEFTENTVSIAERLQLVHYAPGQQYTPHHDFSMPGLVHLQPSRFATVLFYLNDEGLVGGETSFPRWKNAETNQPLKVKPEKGKAVLFYNLLPDGNYDERSQHAALPVIEGEKYLTNLWVWDPMLDHSKTNHI
jgi:prolyl 4-hydroxylase